VIEANAVGPLGEQAGEPAGEQAVTYTRGRSSAAVDLYVPDWQLSELSCRHCLAPNFLEACAASAPHFFLNSRRFPFVVIMTVFIHDRKTATFNSTCSIIACHHGASDPEVMSAPVTTSHPPSDSRPSLTTNVLGFQLRLPKVSNWDITMSTCKIPLAQVSPPKTYVTEQ
jgi:hypothetical protein